MNEEKRPHSLFFPMLLIAVGVLVFLINVGTVPGTTWENLMQYWPVILIIGGLDGLYKRDGWVGPLVLLGFGVVLLLGNLHYLENSGFTILLKLWPILLVAIGLDVIFGHRGSIWGNLIRIFLGLLLIGGIVWLAALSPVFSVGTKTVPFTQTLDGATQSDIRVAVATGEVYLAGGADEDVLLSGTAGLPKEMSLDTEYSEPKDGRSSLSVEGEGVVIVPINSTVSPWNFDLNSEIPIGLSTELGVGQLKIDLSDTQVNNISTEMGVGQTILTLPVGVDVNASVSGAVGELVIRIPKGCEVAITVDRAVVSLAYPESLVRDGDIIRSANMEEGADQIRLDVDLAVGSILIEEMD